jgi:CheY-like chemotaxis protein
MDDQEELRRTLTLCLEELGHRVEQAANSDEACKRYEQALARNDPFDAVILDLTIVGGEGGVVTLDRLQAIDPKVRAIASSGYADSPVLAEYDRHGFVAVLPKPY